MTKPSVERRALIESNANQPEFVGVISRISCAELI